MLYTIHTLNETKVNIMNSTTWANLTENERTT